MSVPSSYLARLAVMSGQQHEPPGRNFQATCTYCGMPVKKGNETREECPTFVIDQAAQALKEENHGEQPAPAGP